MEARACFDLAASCGLDWNGVAAVATALATGVALALPFLIEHRQRNQRNDDRKALIHEAVSQVSRAVAYYEIARKLVETDPVYHDEHGAFLRISALMKPLRSSLEILMTREKLSDGAVASIAAAIEVVHAVHLALRDPHGQPKSYWDSSRQVLDRANLFALIADQRSTAVRAHHQIGASCTAASIHAKYDPMILAWRQAKTDDTGTPGFDVDEGVL